MAKNNQSMSQSASSFRQDINDGTSKEMSATETMARVNASNALVGAMLALAYTYQVFQYNEICRRFCIEHSLDKDVQKFQKWCKKQGIPDECLDVEHWVVEPERVMGAGNKTLEIAQAKEMMGIRPMLDPEPQREVLHDYVLSITDDPARADRYVPISKKVISDSLHDAQLAAGALMMGMPVAIKTGMNHIEYIEALLDSMSMVIKRIAQGQQMGVMITPLEISGLGNIANHIGQHIQILAQDRNEKDRVKKYSDLLGKLANEVKGFAQQFFEKHQSENGQNPELQAKLQAEVIKAQSNAKIKEDKAAQAMSQKDASFQQRMEQEAEKHRMQLGKDLQMTEVEIAKTDLETAATIKRERMNEQP
jgi:hypothetical protein